MIRALATGRFADKVTSASKIVAGRIFVAPVARAIEKLDLGRSMRRRAGQGGALCDRA
jgi:hypothetical protein